MASQRVLVTGGSGFIGSHVVDRLLAAGHRPRIFDLRPSPWHAEGGDVEVVTGDMRRLTEVVGALEGCDAVCHLAAAADVGEVHKHPAESTELNAMGTLNVLEAARRLEIRRVVYASTVWVYSDVEADAVDETTPLVHPAHLYTAGKLSGELFCRSYAELYGLEPTVLRFGIPYGPRARPAAVIPSFVARALAGEALTIAGDGSQERSFVYVEDLAEGVVRALSPVAAGRTYNLAGRETTTVKQLAQLVSDTVAPTEILHTPGRAGDLHGAVVHSELAAQELGWSADTPLRVGVSRYAEWVRREQPDAVASVVRSTSHLRQVAGRLARTVADPVAVGAAGMVAVASAAVTAMLGTDSDTRAATLALVGLAMLLPIWTLIVSSWPREHRRLHASLAAGLATVGVLILGAVSAGELGTPDRWQVVAVLAASGGMAAALMALPRRLALTAG